MRGKWGYEERNMGGFCREAIIDVIASVIRNLPRKVKSTHKVVVLTVTEKGMVHKNQHRVVEVMAVEGGWAMVRRKQGTPYVCPVSELYPQNIQPITK